MSKERKLRSPDAKPAASCIKAQNPFHSENANFALMDIEGRGPGSAKYWEKKTTHEEKIGYCKWLIAKKEIKSRTGFTRKKAPAYILNYVVDNGLWDEIGLPDKRIGNKYSAKQKNIFGKPPKREVPKHPKSGEGKQARPKPAPSENGTNGEDASIHGQHSPLATPSYSYSPFNPIRRTPPLFEPRFRRWKTASEDEQAKMAGEFFESARKGESYNLEKLLSMGIPVDAQGKNGETALMEAAYWCNTGICKILIRMGANPRAKDVRGDSVLDYARDGAEDRGRADTLSFIRKALGLNPLSRKEISKIKKSGAGAEGSCKALIEKAERVICEAKALGAKLRKKLE